MYFRAKKNKEQYVLLGDPIDVDPEGNPLTVMDVVCDETKVKTDNYSEIWA